MKFARRSLHVAFTLLLAARLAGAETTRCLRHSLGDDYGWYHNTALSLLPPTTTAKSRTSIYAARTIDGRLYMHSNLVEEAGGNRVKVLSSDDASLDALAEFLLFGDAQAPRSLERARQARFILDQSLFDEEGRLRVEAPFLREARVSLGRDRTLLAARRLGAAEDASAPWAVQTAPHFAVRVGIDPERLTRRLRAAPFDRRRLSVVTLITDNATDHALSEHGIPIAYGVDEPGAPPTLDALEQTFASKANGVVALLGHFEDGDYVIAGDPSTPELRLPALDLVASARAHGVTLIHLGCRSAGAGPVGMSNLVDSVAAAGMLGHAARASDWDGFLRGLASPQLDLVLSDETSLEVQGVSSPHLILHERKALAAGAAGTIAITFASSLDDSEDDAGDAERPAPVWVGWSGLTLGHECHGKPLACMLWELQHPCGSGIARVVDGSPADAAGLREGDQLLAINGQSCDALSDGRVEAFLTGTPGSDVVLDIARDGEQSTATLALARRLIQAPEQPGGL